MNRGYLMRLHEDKELFNSLIQSAAVAFGLRDFQVEKDYYVSLLLKQLVERRPSIVFKGGTSLSKCYEVIKRFSEDLDVSVPVEEGTTKLSRGQKKQLKTDIVEVIDQLGFDLLNAEEIRSGREFNEYKIAYDKHFVGDAQMSPHILVETNVAFKPFPFEQRPVSNYITQFVMGAAGEEAEKESFFKEYDMAPFLTNVQSIDRTFLDKVFAICDYYEKEESTRYSRHLYDLHKIWQSSYLDISTLEMILPEVIAIRQEGKDTVSSQPGYALTENLQHIIATSFYKQDYHRNTKTFLAEDVSYEETINSLEAIIQKGFLPKRIE